MTNYKRCGLNYLPLMAPFLKNVAFGGATFSAKHSSFAERENFKNLKADTKNFVDYSDKLTRLCVVALENDSFLETISDNSKLLSQRELRFAYRFWSLFYVYFNKLNAISKKYKVSLIFRHKEQVKKHFDAYTLGIAAKVVMASSVSHLMIYLKNRGKLHILLNEPNEEYGYPARSLNKVVKYGLRLAAIAQIYKFKYLYYKDIVENMEISTEIISPDIINYLIIKEKFINGIIFRSIKEASWEFLNLCFISNIMEKFNAVKQVIMSWGRNIPKTGSSDHLIGSKDAEGFTEYLSPGDIVLSRNEGNVTNILLKGFWVHAMLHIGTPKDIYEHLDKDPLVMELCCKYSVNSFTELLKKEYPEATEKWLEADRDNGDAPRQIIESMSAGVVITSVQQAFKNDHLVAMRPRLRPVDKARAIMRAFTYFGREYDLCFSFITEKNIVCTELVAKAYTADNDQEGLTFILEKMFGIMVIPSNLVAEKYSMERNTSKQELDFVAFLHGSQKNQTVNYATEEEFSESYLWDDGLISKNAK